MGNAEFHRMYYLACELRPKLPDKGLLNLLPPILSQALDGAIRHGIGSGFSNIDQLAAIYMKGSEYGADPTEDEFRGLICREISNALCEKDLSLSDKMKFMGMLSNYYKGGIDLVETETVPFDAEGEDIEKFASGLPALDRVCGGGLAQCVMTLIGKPGMGKSSMALNVAANWKYGSVDYFEPEMGKNMMLSKVRGMGLVFPDPKPLFHFGTYDPESILDYVKSNPDPNRLVVCDSLHIPCGLGDTPESRAKYERFYKTAIKIKELSRLVLITTQVKRGDDGESIESAAGSSSIERYSRVLLSIRKGDILPDGTNEAQFYTMKNSFYATGERIKFKFDYSSNTFKGIIEDDLDRALEDVLG